MAEATPKTDAVKTRLFTSARGFGVIGHLLSQLEDLQELRPYWEEVRPEVLCRQLQQKQ